MIAERYVRSLYSRVPTAYVTVCVSFCGTALYDIDIRNTLEFPRKVLAAMATANMLDVADICERNGANNA